MKKAMIETEGVIHIIQCVLNVNIVSCNNRVVEWKNRYSEFLM